MDGARERHSQNKDVVEAPPRRLAMARKLRAMTGDC
ncbi:uncharacterized protein G2W53_025287 [Senna tora]|uniref:Uncharacterized protein n=1 Tax=Senna tora TaxID=362788 RepID=A0A834WEM2_9FABA|nr:uncharacterized protein G2W53_025287 [Senna tora]